MTIHYFLQGYPFINKRFFILTDSILGILDKLPTTRLARKFRRVVMDTAIFNHIF